MQDQKELVSIAIAANVPVLMVGPPGSGKTSFVQAYAGQAGAHLETIIASLRDPTDFAGLPLPNKQNNGDAPSVSLAAPSWAHRLVEAITGSGIAWLFIDEITTCAPAVQAALLRVIHENVVGDVQLPLTVRMISAANPADQAAGGWDLSPPLANRFMHVDWSVTAQEWSDGILQGFPEPPLLTLPKGWTTQILKHKANIGSFVRAMPQLLNAVPKNESEAGGPWPSGRTWDMSARLVAAAEATGKDKDVHLALIAGCVGANAATQYLEWLKKQDLPDPEDLLNHPSDFTMPDRADKVYAVLASVVAAVLGNLTPARYAAGWEIIAKSADSGVPEVGATAARTLAAKFEPTKLPIPPQFVKPFIPMLKEAGLIQQ